MEHIKRYFWLYLLALSGLWWLTDPPALATLTGLRPWRDVLMQVTGVLGIGVMSAGMVLALRPKWFEPRLGGLDKMYRLHKWLGIAGLVLAISHWVVAQGPKWLSGLGLIAPRVRGPRPEGADAAVSFLQSQRGLAEGIGEWAFYAAVLLIVLALVKRFPYKRFFQTHKLLAVVYLALVFHSVVLLKPADWTGPLGPVFALLMAAGSVGAVLVLTGRLAARRRIVGEVLAVRHHTPLNVLEVDVLCAGQWPGHAAGQFAFVTLHADEGAHPYTISSAWTGDGRITFIIKALGDYTGTLAERVKVGDHVNLEGPYGRFTFEGTQRRQIWVGGGIGITPFIARMQALARQRSAQPVDLFHTTAVYDPHAIGLLERDARSADVRLHLLWDERDGRLDAERIAEAVPEWREADVWFCGPAGFGRALKEGLAALGLPKTRFHQEIFEMR